MRYVRLAVAAGVLATAVTGGADSTPATRLFVDLGAEIVEYDLSTGRSVRAIPVPPDRAIGTRISINRLDQIAIMLTPGVNQTRLWLWSGGEGRLVTRPLPRMGRNDELLDRAANAQRPVHARLSADGRNLYWLTNDTTVSRVVARGSGEDSYQIPEIVLTARVDRTDLEGRDRVEIGAISFPPCVCDTGSCEETCREAEWWTPEDGITSSFFVTAWIPGQTGSTFLETRRFVEKARHWQQEILPQTVKRVADLVSEDLYIEIEPDGGCCGWENFNSNLTTLVTGKSRHLLFDEWARIGNRHYDVSFFSWNARVSPDLLRVAQTLDVTVGGRNGDEIRLSPEAKPDRHELQRIQIAIRDLPAVEVLRANGTVLRRIAHRRLIGWRDSNHVVLLAGESVVILDLGDGRELATGIRLRLTDAAYVDYSAQPSGRIWLN